MKTAEEFKIWLEKIYISKKTGKPLTTGTQYVTGLNALNKKFNLKGEGLFDNTTDLNKIRELIDKPENFHKDYSSHFNAFVLFRKFNIERKNINRKPLQRKVNVFKRQQVELAAIEEVIQHYEKNNYIVISKEKDNVGWDLEATNSNETLLIEVKGLSGKIVSIELTPNEYIKSKDNQKQYRICIVTNSLIKPKMEIYKYDLNNNYWINKQNEKLTVQERVAARMYKE